MEIHKLQQLLSEMSLQEKIERQVIYMTENIENNGCSQRDSAEHEGYVKASRSFNRIWKERDSAQLKLLEKIRHTGQL